MTEKFDPVKNNQITRQKIGYVNRKDADMETYTRLGFKCGLEIHQQLKTKKKLFCRCPAGIYQGPNDHSAEIVRHMRPTLSELGEYDGTALMEFKTKKNVIYRIKNETACTYEVDDTPPFVVNRDAIDIAVEIALLLKTNIVGEFHITRKQYLDGSIPTGFQRTGIVGIEGEIPLSNKKVKIIQLSLEEDSCREVSDIGHWRIYTTDRLGMPLVETVTYPDMLTPDEAAEAGHYIRFLTRSTGKVNTGIGAAREDVNVSITGGTRVEIKGVARISWIPGLTHNEGFRQKALLTIKDELNHRIPDTSKWRISSLELPMNIIDKETLPLSPLIKPVNLDEYKVMAVNLPKFKEILSFFTQPGKSFSDEISDRLKVIACLEKPNMTHSEELNHTLDELIDFDKVRSLLKSEEDDAQLVFWGPAEDVKTALETIEERCLMAFERVPNETRKSLKDGTTIFERVLPGPDRMYPDTDSAPIPIKDDMIDKIRGQLPAEVVENVQRLREWKIPQDTYSYILKRNLFPTLERIIKDFNHSPRFVGTFIGHCLKHVEGQAKGNRTTFNYERIYNLFAFINEKKLEKEIIKFLMPQVYHYPERDFNTILKSIGYRSISTQEILGQIPVLKEKFREQGFSKEKSALSLWIMGQLKPLALGNMDLSKLKSCIDGDNNE
ncbi:MAG: Glu-tRNA(Gln) amidotransferase subunit GatE [Acidobacteria bacterium]|jgi:glutamyl-tRNA(Gln) amidotransferase subunit E|nr:Glu-tRNA(Gln) amidotransferase subunit GatE [Acidobacteriota bacterium]